MEILNKKRDDFTSEIYKIEVRNLAKFGFGEFKKLLHKKLGLKPVKIKARDKLEIAYICFRNEEDRTIGLDKLNGYVWKGKKLTATLAKAIVDPMQKKRSADSAADNGSTIKKTVLEATAPLANLPYDQQIELKTKHLVDLLKEFGNELIKSNRMLKKQINDHQEKFDGLPCRFDGLMRSPQINGYRNKSEFTIGKSKNGDKHVGFRLGSYIDGSIEVEPIDDLPHIPDRMKFAAKVFETFIRSSSFEIFNPEYYTGVFRQLSVRHSQATGEIMLIVGLHTKEIEDSLVGLKEDILNYFTAGDGKELNVTSIYIEMINKRESGQLSNRMEHIYGTEYITDVIHGLRFRISAASFFQINTSAAEVLYQAAIDIGKPTVDTTVLDICCGTGTIGLCFSKHCKQVFGVEIIEDAIIDANFNARENQIKNSQFFAGNCNDYIHHLVHKAESRNLLAIIDPPRAGLHLKSISAIRKARGLDRLVYVSCSPKSAKRNWLDLTRPYSKSLQGEPFVPVHAVGVDMFPHTNHQELIILFERINSSSVTTTGDQATLGELSADKLDVEMSTIT